MAWAKIDDLFPFHRKVRRLTNAAFRLHVSAICWANANLTDGHIPTTELRHVSDVSNPKKYATELVTAGLWDAIEDGWLIHDYLDFQPSAEKIRKEREAKRVRQENWLAKRHAQNGSRDASHVTSREALETPTPSPSPLPLPKGSGERGSPKHGATGRAGPSGSPVRAVSDWCGSCDERTRQIDPDRPRRCPACHPLRHQEAS